MIKKFYFTLLFLLLHSYFCKAQPPQGENQNRLETIKIAYITKELNLSSEEAQKFWPAYNGYMEEIKQAGTKYQDDEVGYEEKVVEIKKKYKGNFQKVLGSDARVNKMFTADRNYRDVLTRELQNRQKLRKQNQGQPVPNKNQRNQQPQGNKKKPGHKN